MRRSNKNRLRPYESGVGTRLNLNKYKGTAPRRTGRLHRRRGQCRMKFALPKEESIGTREKGSPFIVAVVGLAAVTSAKASLRSVARQQLI